MRATAHHLLLWRIGDARCAFSWRFARSLSRPSGERQIAVPHPTHNALAWHDGPTRPRRSAPDFEKPCRVAAFDLRTLFTLEPGYSGDEPERIVDAHVVGVVGAEQHMTRAVMVDQVLQH